MHACVNNVGRSVTEHPEFPETAPLRRPMWTKSETKIRGCLTFIFTDCQNFASVLIQLKQDWLRRVATIPIALVVESGAEISGERTGQTRLPIVNCGRFS